MISVLREIFLTGNSDNSRPSYYSLAAWKLLLYGAWLSLVVIAGASIALINTVSRSNRAAGPVFGCGNAPMHGDDLYVPGRSLFQGNCASCHHPMKDAVGPALAPVLQRREAGFLEKFLTRRNSLRKDSAICSRKRIFGTECLEFPELQHEDIELLERYIRRKPAY